MLDQIKNDLQVILQSSDSCVTCGAFDILQTITDTLMYEYFVLASDAVFYLVTSFIGLYLVWTFVGGLMDRPFDKHELLEMFLRCTIVSALVSVPDDLFSAFHTLLGLSTYFGAAAIQVVVDAGGDSDLTGIGAIMQQVETTFRGGFGHQLIRMWRDLGWRDIPEMLAILILVIPLAFLAWEMIKYFFRPMFYAYAIGMLLPFILAALIFNKTVPIFVNALRVLGASSLQLVLSASMVSFILVIIGTVSALAGEQDIVLFGTFYVTILVTVVVMIFLFPVVMSIPDMLLDVIQGGQPGSFRDAAAKALPILKRRKA